MRRVVPLRRHALALTAALAALGVPAAARADGLVSTPAEVQFGFERLHLPAGEHLGLAGAGYLLEPPCTKAKSTCCFASRSRRRLSREPAVGRSSTAMP